MSDDAEKNGTPDQPAPPEAPAQAPPEAPSEAPAGASTDAPTDALAEPTEPPAAAPKHAAPAPEEEQAADTPPPPPPPPAAAPVADDAPLPAKAGRTGFTGALVPLGAGALGAAIVIASWRSRSDGELDWSNYVVGLGATAVLLLVAVLGAVGSRRVVGGRAREDVVTWPGVVGIAGVAAMIEVGIDSDDRAVGYLVGAVVTGLAVIGYLLARRAAFVVTAIAGLALLYGLAFDDLIADSIDEDNGIVVLAIAVAIFVLAVTVIGWALPSRAVSGVAVGAFGVVAMSGLLAALLAMRLISEFLGGFLPGLGGLGGGGFGDDFGGMGGMDGSDQFGMGGMDGTDGTGSGFGFSESDVWWVLILALGLAVLWALASSLTSHSGFSILAIVMPTITVPLAAAALAVEHPTWWSGVLAAGGGVVLLGAVLLARGRGRSVARERELAVGADR